jgi:hypothetical protein
VAQYRKVLIPAGGRLMAVLVDAVWIVSISAPVLNGLIAVIKVAELAVAMRRLPPLAATMHHASEHRMVLRRAWTRQCADSSVRGAASNHRVRP